MLDNTLGEGFRSSEIWAAAGNRPLVSNHGYNRHPKAITLFNEVTRMLDWNLREAAYAGLGNYYLINLNNNHLVVVLSVGALRQFVLVDLSKTTMGLLMSVVLPNLLNSLTEADIETAVNLAETETAADQSISETKAYQAESKAPAYPAESKTSAHPPTGPLKIKTTIYPVETEITARHLKLITTAYPVETEATAKPLNIETEAYPVETETETSREEAETAEDSNNSCPLSAMFRWEGQMVIVNAIKSRPGNKMPQSSPDRDLHGRCIFDRQPQLCRYMVLPKRKKK